MQDFNFKVCYQIIFLEFFVFNQILQHFGNHYPDFLKEKLLFFKFSHPLQLYFTLNNYLFQVKALDSNEQKKNSEYLPSQDFEESTKVA